MKRFGPRASTSRPGGRAIAGVISTLWLGVLVGVSFMATPIKFQAPSLDLPTALEVGRETFHLLTRVEWGFWLALATTGFWSKGPALRLVFIGMLGVVLALQTFWLLPILDLRVAQIIAGETVASSPYHLFYIAADAFKAVILLIWSVVATRALARGRE